MSNLNLDPTTDLLITTLTTPDPLRTRKVLRPQSPIHRIGRFADVSDRMAARREGRR